MKSIGKLIYSPRSHLLNSDKWVILFCDDEISKYYRTLYIQEQPWKNKLNRPIWGAHISCIRGEYIPKAYHNLWGLDNNKIVEFEYEPGVKDNGEYFWLTVHCPYLLDLREKYGLVREPKYGLHLTIGRT